MFSQRLKFLLLSIVPAQRLKVPKYQNADYSGIHTLLIVFLDIRPFSWLFYFSLVRLICKVPCGAATPLALDLEPHLAQWSR